MVIDAAIICELCATLPISVMIIFYLHAGTLCFASVTWYAVDVVRDFWLKNGLESTTFQYEFGAALYVGWVSSVRHYDVIITYYDFL